MTTTKISCVLARLLATGAAGALFALGILTVAPPKAQALQQYSQQTGLGCASCHVSPGGGGALKPLGKRFQANGHRLPGKKK
jgi:hypothetical protein